MKLPTLQRRKSASGKYTGSYFIAIGGQQFSLGTSDAVEAGKRRLEAVKKGRRNFSDEIDEAAAAVEPDAASAASASTAPPVADAASASTALHPDAVIPPPPAPQVPLLLPPAPPSDAAAEAAATNEAAAEDPDDQADAGAAGAAPSALPPDVLDSFLEQGAAVVVDLQLELQATLIRKRLGRKPDRIPDDAPARKMAAAAWVAQLKIWIPPDKMLPPWALALLLPVMCIPQQLANSQPIKPEGPAASGDQPVAAAA